MGLGVCAAHALPLQVWSTGTAASGLRRTFASTTEICRLTPLLLLPQLGAVASGSVCVCISLGNRRTSSYAANLRLYQSEEEAIAFASYSNNHTFQNEANGSPTFFSEEGTRMRLSLKDSNSDPGHARPQDAWLLGLRLPCLCSLRSQVPGRSLSGAKGSV